MSLQGVNRISGEGQIAMKVTLLMAFAVALILAILVPALRVRHYEFEFDAISDGSTREFVLAKMGRPWKQEKCGEYLGGVAPGCVQEFIYAHPYAPYSPEYWVVQFDANKKVVSHVHLISP